MKRFFKCDSCGNILVMVHEGGGPLKCCGKDMNELKANTEEASTEKHLPVIDISTDKVTVSVGSVPHPMEKAHHIEFVYLETKRGGQLKFFKLEETPTITFALLEDELIAAYEYCNLHGLWKTDYK